MTGATSFDVCLDIPAGAEYVSLVRLLVSFMARMNRSIPSDRVEDLKLAVSEAATNAVESGSSVSADARVRITFQGRPDRVIVRVIDQGPGFDVDSVAPAPEVNEPGRLQRERGLGIKLMRSMVDEVKFESGSTGTTVELVIGRGTDGLPAD